jgi:beta-galactosidase
MNMNLKNIALFFLAIVAPSSLCAQSRREVNISQWQFSRDSVHWQQVSVPHDWAISGPFDKKWDLQKVAIAQNGETQKTEKSGRSGALPWIGKGYYKTKFRLSDNAQHAELLFDGAMSEPVIYVNGHRAGSWAYGYNAFRIDITPYLYRATTPLRCLFRTLRRAVAGIRAVVFIVR